jgi:hypothetical protein
MHFALSRIPSHFDLNYADRNCTSAVRGSTSCLIRQHLIGHRQAMGDAWRTA